MGKLLRRFLLILVLLPVTAAAHEYWIAPAEFHPAPGADLSVKVCQGHDFPRCENFEFPETFAGLTVAGQGASERLDLRADADGAGVAEWAVSAAGRYVLTMQLIMTRRGREIPMYTARTEVFVPGQAAQAPPPAPEKGLTIQMVEDLGASTAPERITLRVLSDGRPAQAGLEIQPEGGRKFSVSTDMNGEASLRLPAPGRYLVYTSLQGVSGSLSFAVPPRPAAE